LSPHVYDRRGVFLWIVNMIKPETEDERDYYEERIAIRQFLGGYYEQRAEELARLDLANYRDRKQLQIFGNSEFKGTK